MQGRYGGNDTFNKALFGVFLFFLLLAIFTGRTAVSTTLNLIAVAVLLDTQVVSSKSASSVDKSCLVSLNDQLAVFLIYSVFRQFDSELVGVAVFAENAKVDRDIHEYKSLLTVSDIDVKSQKVEVEVGNIFDKSKA